MITTKIRIVKCSLPYMWYRNLIGCTFEVTKVRNENTIFSQFTEFNYSYKTTEPQKINRVNKLKTISNGRTFALSNPEHEDIEVEGWILIEDIEIV